MKPKPFWKSRTLWFNGLIAALAAIEANAMFIQPLIPGNVYGWGILILSAGNAVLRAVTGQRVGLR